MDNFFSLYMQLCKCIKFSIVQGIIIVVVVCGTDVESSNVFNIKILYKKMPTLI